MIFARAADMRPSTWNPEALTVEAVFSTGAPVTRRDARGSYVERLSLDAINPADLVGLTVFSDHVESVRTAVGVVTEARREGDSLVGTIKVSAAPDVESVRVKIGEGVSRSVSLGYTVSRWRDSVDASGRRVRTAAEWRIHEISLVGRPADPHATIRNTTPMPTEQTEAQQTRAAIRDVARTAGLPVTWADEQIDADATVGTARSAAFEAMAAQRQAAPKIRAAVGASSEDPAVTARRMVEALAADAAGVPVTDEGANQYRGLGFRGLARLAVEGLPGARFMSDAAMIDAAFTRDAGASHSTSDFPTALLGTGNRIVAHAYGEAVSPIEQHLVTYGTAQDFRPVTEVGLGGLPNLQQLSENGEIQSVSTVENSTTWTPDTYGGRIDVSRKMLVNNDLGLFGRISDELGRAARRTETAAIVALLVSNPTMTDSKALFHADHGNLSNPGNSISAYLFDAIVAIQAQRGLGGEVIGLRPAYLLVSPSQEFHARQALATIHATKVEDFNPLANALELLVEPRLTGNDWYVFAKPSQAPVLKVGHLAGQRGPVVQQQERWTGLGTSFRVFTDFGVTAVDFRGAYRNDGGS